MIMVGAKNQQGGRSQGTVLVNTGIDNDELDHNPRTGVHNTWPRLVFSSPVFVQSDHFCQLSSF